MNVLLIFFAFPVAVIILSAIFATLIRCPIKIAGITFAIFLVITFAFFDATFLIATIVYTILSFITAAIVRAILRNNNENSNSCLSSELINLINQNETILRRIIGNQNNLNNTCNRVNSTSNTATNNIVSNGYYTTDNIGNTNTDTFNLENTVSSEGYPTSTYNSSNCACLGNNYYNRIRKR